MDSVYATVIQNAGWAEIPLGILRMEGADAQKWLHKIVTADIASLQTGQGARSALLDAKGHFVAAFSILRDEDIFGAFVEPSARETLFNALRRYIIRDKVILRDVTDLWTCVSVIGPDAAARLEHLFGVCVPDGAYNWVWGKLDEHAARIVHSIRARVPSYDVMMPLAGIGTLRAALQDLAAIPEPILETLRVEAGLPRWGIDFDESTLALEIPDVMQIRVDQGCYVGQEVVARIVHRGHVNRHLRGLKMESGVLPARGEAIHLNGAEVGQVTSALNSPLFGGIALGYVRREVELGAAVKINDAHAHVVELPFEP